MNLSPKTLFKHPHLISRVGKGENASKQLKLQIKKLQELYRFVRDSEEHYGATTLDLLLNVFEKYHPHIKYVDYIERNVVYLPANYYPRWVKIPVNPFLYKIESAIKTSRVIVIDEGYYSYGVTAEIASVIAEGAFYHLEAPVKRIGAMDVPIPFSPVLEDLTVPNVGMVVEMAKTLCAAA